MNNIQLANHHMLELQQFYNFKRTEKADRSGWILEGQLPTGGYTIRMDISACYPEVAPICYLVIPNGQRISNGGCKSVSVSGICSPAYLKTWNPAGDCSIIDLFLALVSAFETDPPKFEYDTHRICQIVSPVCGFLLDVVTVAAVAHVRRVLM
jgi:hypothetical protein